MESEQQIARSSRPDSGEGRRVALHYSEGASIETSKDLSISVEERTDGRNEPALVVIGLLTVLAPPVHFSEAH